MGYSLGYLSGLAWSIHLIAMVSAMNGKLVSVIPMVLLIGGGTVACSPRVESGDRAQTAVAQSSGVELRGGELDPARPRPDFELATVDGAGFDFAAETRGTLTLLFFGYTNCPDVCPVHMSNLAQVRKTLAPSVNAKLKVVFVTTDPERDTPEVLKAWLDKVGGGIIGLTGSQEAVAMAQRAAGVPVAFREGEGPDYGVGHMAWVLAITPDDMVRRMYGFGTRQEDWSHDIPLLMERYPAS